jgi:hypothetical protein
MDAYASAAILVYTGLWRDLEEVYERLTPSTDDDDDADADDGPMMRRMTIVRLEISILLDACESLRWRSMLGAGERSALHATLKSVLDTLDVPSARLSRTVLGAAQNQLFESVMTLSANRPEAPAKPSVPSHLPIETLAYA